VSTGCGGASQGGACDNDAADHCTGTSNSCVDVFQAMGTTCLDDGDQCTSDTCSGSSAVCGHACIPVAVDLQYMGDLFVSTAGPTVGTATVVLSGHVTPQTNCQTLTDLKVRFRVFQQNSLSGTPVFNQVASVNSQGDALIVLNGANSLAVGQYTVRAAVEPLACWLTASADACLTVDLGTTDRRVTGGGWIPTLSGNRKANFGFTVGFNKNGTLKGNSIYMLRGDDGYNYLVKSTSWNTGGLTFLQGCNMQLTRGRYSANAVIQKIDPDTELVLSSIGNCSLVVDIGDGDLCSPRERDQYAIRVMLSNGTTWWGSYPTLQDLGGGNVKVFSK